MLKTRRNDPYETYGMSNTNMCVCYNYRKLCATMSNCVVYTVRALQWPSVLGYLGNRGKAGAKLWSRFLTLARSMLRLCSVNHRAGYFSNLACGWLNIVWAYSKQETENGPWSICRSGKRLFQQCFNRCTIFSKHNPWDATLPSVDMFIYVLTFLYFIIITKSVNLYTVYFNGVIVLVASIDIPIIYVWNNHHQTCLLTNVPRLLIGKQTVHFLGNWLHGYLQISVDNN